MKKDRLTGAVLSQKHRDKKQENVRFAWNFCERHKNWFQYWEVYRPCSGISQANAPKARPKCNRCERLYWRDKASSCSAVLQEMQSEGVVATGSGNLPQWIFNIGVHRLERMIITTFQEHNVDVVRWWRALGLAPSRNTRSITTAAKALHQEENEVDDLPWQVLTAIFVLYGFEMWSPNGPQPAAEHQWPAIWEGRWKGVVQFRSKRAFTMRKIPWERCSSGWRHAWKACIRKKAYPEFESRSPALLTVL